MWSTGLLVQFSMFHFALVLGLLCKILTQDPGALGHAESDPRFTCIADLVEKNEKPQRFCPYCEVRRIAPGTGGDEVGSKWVVGQSVTFAPDCWFTVQKQATVTSSFIV